VTQTPFKACTACDRVWATRDELLDDPETSFTGYQAFVHDGVLGLFLFDHRSCGTTLAVSAARFEDLRQGPTYDPSHGDPEHPSPHCLTAGSGASCPEECECAFVQHVIETITKD
jgi:hypothetical protein